MPYHIQRTEQVAGGGATVSWRVVNDSPYAGWTGAAYATRAEAEWVVQQLDERANEETPHHAEY